MSVTPETLTFEHIKTWSGDEMKRQMAHPDMRIAVMNVISSRNLEEVAAAQDEINSRTETVVEVPPTEVVSETTPEEIAAGDQRKEAEEVNIVETEAARKAAEAPKKFVVDYQCKDEDGNPIGRPTHLEAATSEELIDKMKVAHEQAVRAFNRLKKQKISFKDQQPKVIQKSDEELLAAMKDLRSDDPAKQLEAVRKVQKADDEKKEADRQELERQRQVSKNFLDAHKHDFNNCKANIELIKEYFEENPELLWTSDNLEIAFHALEHKLAQVVEPTAPAAPANPEPVSAPVRTTKAASPAVQPEVIAPVPAPPPANPAVVAHRPGVNGGMVPGQSSGSRPTAISQKGLTAEEIRSWDGPTMKAKMRDPRVRPQIEAFLAIRNRDKK